MKRLSLLLLSLLLLTACGKASEDVAELHEWVASETPSSRALIDRAVEEGGLDYETGLIYKAYSAFGDEKLPDEYLSGGFVYEYNDVFREIQRNWDQLSQKAKDELGPFLKRPDDPESYFSLKYADAPASDSSAFIPSAYAERVSAYTEFYVSADGRVKIWYPKVDMMVKDAEAKPDKMVLVKATDAEKMAKKIKGYLDGDGIVASFDKLMNRTFLKDGTKGGDDRLDVYIAPMASSLALTYCEGNPPCSSFILVASNIGAAKDDVLKTTFAHELFHAYQYAYKYKEPADDWWSESTATWAEDFIYPAANTEQGYLRGFILRPDVGLAFKEKVGLFQYGAYIFPYFLSFNYGDDFMSKTWEGCESGRCDKGVDGVIDGGFKKQWQEFTLWNYNRDPAQFYTDVGPFPTLSSIDAQEAGQVITDGTSEDKINTELLSPLSAHLVKVINIADNKKINKLTFKDLRKFTGRSDKLAIKAIINYANGRKEVEDWTDKDKRSFCIESSEENFENVILIFSSAELDKEFDDVDVTVVGKDNCFNISQEEDRTAVVHFPYADGGVHKTVDINTTIETNSWGEPEEEAEEGQEYAYLTEWRVRNEFEQVKEAFTMDCQGSTVDYGPGWKTRSAGYIVFDLGPEGLSEDGTFSVDFDYGYAHPRGQYEEVPAFTATCAGVGVGAQNIDLSSYKLYMEDIWQGRIFDMTKDGAKIEIFNSCLYHDCTTQQGAPFQTISEPVILEIRRGSE